MKKPEISPLVISCIALFVLFVLANIALLRAVNRLSTARQQLQACTNHINGLQMSIGEGRIKRNEIIEFYQTKLSQYSQFYANVTTNATLSRPTLEQCRTNRPVEYHYIILKEVWRGPIMLTNQMQYPPRFMLK